MDGVTGTQPHRQRWPQRASAQEELIMDSTDFNVRRVGAKEIPLIKR